MLYSVGLTFCSYTKRTYPFYIELLDRISCPTFLQVINQGHVIWKTSNRCLSLQLAQFQQAAAHLASLPETDEQQRVLKMRMTANSFFTAYEIIYPEYVSQFPDLNLITQALMMKLLIIMVLFTAAYFRHMCV